MRAVVITALAALCVGCAGRDPQPIATVVGERGPEVFVPSVPGTVVPQYAEPNFGLARELPGQEMPAISPRVEAWDRWLANAPMTENIEDRRGDDQIDMDNIRWQRMYGPKKALKQFPPAETKSTFPDWLKDQESQWLKPHKTAKPYGAKLLVRNVKREGARTRGRRRSGGGGMVKDER
jgi:hypothetical protein